MQLMIDGIQRDFVRLSDYMAAHDLPKSFGVALFEPKDYTGLGHINWSKMGPALAQIEDDLLASVPAGVSAQAWLGRLSGLARQFERMLTDINPEIGLQTVEIEYASAGFEDMLRNYLYAWIRASVAPDFMGVYMAWLWESTRVAVTEHSYAHQGQGWRVQVVSYVYGRVGLIVHRPAGTDYVLDARLACPAEGFMEGLLSKVAARMSA